MIGKVDVSFVHIAQLFLLYTMFCVKSILLTFIFYENTIIIKMHKSEKLGLVHFGIEFNCLFS